MPDAPVPPVDEVEGDEAEKKKRPGRKASTLAPLALRYERCVTKLNKARAAAEKMRPLAEAVTAAEKDVQEAEAALDAAMNALDVSPQ
jgi:hypothetical protein